jgi:hypothetical protein
MARNLIGYVRVSTGKIRLPGAALARRLTQGEPRLSGPILGALVGGVYERGPPAR